MAFLFDTEPHWVKIYVKVTHDLHMTFVTYLQKVIGKKLQMLITSKVL